MKITNIKRTRGSKRLASYFNDVIRREDFRKEICTIRNDFNIPQEGFTYDNSIPLGDYAYPLEHKLDKKEKIFEKIFNRVDVLCRKLKLADDAWTSAIWDYIFFNCYSTEESITGHEFDVCGLSDFESQNNFTNDEFGKILKDYASRFEREYPIILGINPSASLKEIIDFLNKNNKKLKNLQDKYRYEKIPITREKNKIKQEIKDFIYDNQNLPRKKIASLVAKKFGVYFDYNHVGIIISSENKRRRK